MYGAPMSFVPTLCLSCSRVHLASLATAQSRELICKTCGADARVVPGCSFPASEQESFEELSAIVAEGSLGPTEARGYGAQVERALYSGSPASILEVLSERLPGLLPHQVAVGRNSGAQRRILSKLKTILEAIGTARGQSAEYAIVQLDPSRQRAASRG
jgi:hypothetical protein